jgi:hypothetical protein
MKGFDPKWCKWIQEFVSRESVGIHFGHKSEIYCFGQAKEMEENYRDLFGCDSGSFPFEYMGIPIHFKRQV